ncbi:MAG: DUF5018 domain-containing protein [Propionibacteriaceae bacterium]|jgi:hypothetical protein|nr:DUF5018 domain-containing protein [Propionibacteriaceae bacterium]
MRKLVTIVVGCTVALGLLQASVAPLASAAIPEISNITLSRHFDSTFTVKFDATEKGTVVFTWRVNGTGFGDPLSLSLKAGHNSWTLAMPHNDGSGLLKLANEIELSFWTSGEANDGEILRYVFPLPPMLAEPTTEDRTEIVNASVARSSEDKFTLEFDSAVEGWVKIDQFVDAGVAKSHDALSTTIGHHSLEFNAMVNGLETTSIRVFVSDEDGQDLEQSWVLVSIPSFQTSSATKEITSLTIGEVAGVITGTTIAVTVPTRTDVTSVVPTIVHNGASISPTGAQDFTKPVTYTVTAEDGSTKAYVVTVTVATEEPKANSTQTPAKPATPKVQTGASVQTGVGAFAFLLMVVGLALISVRRKVS